MTLNEMCMLFEITPIIASRYVNIMLEIIVEKLCGFKSSKIKFPSRKKMVKYAAMVERRELTVCRSNLEESCKTFASMFERVCYQQYFNVVGYGRIARYFYNDTFED